MTPAYLFDIDGTLADCSHRIHHIMKQPKDWETFFSLVSDDKPIPHMCNLAITLYDADQTLVFVSGRSDECREQTAEWLATHVVEAPLFMRRAGDHRDDDIVKIELLAEVRAAGYEPIIVFEDRTRVVKAFRDVGIPCAQVAAGDF